MKEVISYLSNRITEGAQIKGSFQYLIQICVVVSYLKKEPNTVTDVSIRVMFESLLFLPDPISEVFYGILHTVTPISLSNSGPVSDR